MTASHDPAAVVQRQLDAYNARDLDAIVAIYAPDARQFELPGKLVASGSDQIRERMGQRFQERDLYAHLLQRVVMGKLVIDQELLTRNFPEGVGTVDVVAIYEVEGDRIRSATVQVSNKQLRPQP